MHFRQARGRHSAMHRMGRLLSALAVASLPAAALAENNEVKLTSEQMRSLGVRTVRPLASPTDTTLPYPAQIVIPTPQVWVVSAPAAGMIARLSVAHGDSIVAGQQIAVLESPNFVSLQRDYLQAVAQNTLAAQQLSRTIQLVDGKAVPQRTLEASQTEARQASIAVAERRQMLRLSGLSDDAIAKLTNEAAINAVLSVSAPQAATVVDIMVSPGQRVEQSAPLIKLAKLSPLWAEIAVPAANVNAIRQGAKAEIEGYSVPGHVLLVSQTVDAATQTVLVRAELPNNGELRPGQVASARLGFVSAGENAWEVPYSALIRRGEQASIFIAIDGGFRLIPVSLLAEDQDHVVISGAITAKDEVAVSGISALRGILLRLSAG